jgi:hypothetical protein
MRGLVAGAGLFGISWGLSGFCPGAAVSSLPLLAKGTLIFVPAMLGGIALARLIRPCSLSNAWACTARASG